MSLMMIPEITEITVKPFPGQVIASIRSLFIYIHSFCFHSFFFASCNLKPQPASLKQDRLSVTATGEPVCFENKLNTFKSKLGSGQQRTAASVGALICHCSTTLLPRRHQGRGQRDKGRPGCRSKGKNRKEHEG